MTPAKTEKSASTGTVRVSRVIKAPQERVYNAFLDPDALAKWLPPGGFTGKVHKLEAKVGGSYRMSFTSLNKKWTQAFGGKYLELTPHSKIKYTDVFETDDPNMKGEMVTTILFTKVKDGTKVDVEQTGVPKVIPVESAVEGWGQSLNNLQALVEGPEWPPSA